MQTSRRNSAYRAVAPIGGFINRRGKRDDDEYFLDPQPPYEYTGPLGFLYDPLVLLGSLLPVAQIAAGVAGIVAAISIVQSADKARSVGYPECFNRENWDAWRYPLLLLAISYGASALESIAAHFIAIAVNAPHSFLNNSITRDDENNKLCPYPEVTFMDQTRQLVFAIGDIATASAFALLYYQHYTYDSYGDVADNVIGADVPSTIVQSTGISNDPVEVQRLVMGQLRQFSDHPFQLLLLLGTTLRLFGMVFQMVTSEGLNVFYVFPFCRCGFEYSGNAEIDDVGKPMLPVELEEKYGGLCLTQSQSGSEKINRCACLAAFLHNWTGALRMWIYVGVIFLFFAAVCFYWAAAGPTTPIVHPELHVWPIIMPTNTSALAEQQLAKTDTPMLMSTLKLSLYETAVFPRNISMIPPGIDSNNDATYYTNVAAILLLCSEIFRTFGQVGYLLGVATTVSAIPSNHVDYNLPGLSQVRRCLYP